MSQVRRQEKNGGATMSGGGPIPLSAAAAGFKWIDILEKEFDKSYISLEELFRSLSEVDYELMCEFQHSHLQLLSNLGSCFAQLVHKAQTVFQTNAKCEAELIHLREEAAAAKASEARLDSEKQYLVCRLQSALLENHKLRGEKPAAASAAPGPAVDKDDQVCRAIQSKLADEMAMIRRVDWDAKRLEDKCRRVETENERLRQAQVELESELVGARLDSKYLDKELAGRIQQIQILLAAGTSQQHKQKVWGQIEMEMHLQRSKTISNMCYSKQRVKEAAADRKSRFEAQQEAEEDAAGKGEEPAKSLGSSASLDDGRKASFSSSTAGSQDNFHQHANKIKQVHIHKNDSEELGMAILGGHEHGLPIMISEVFPNTAVGRCKKICAGDVILGVNGDSFEDMGHQEAVRYLSALRGTIRFDLETRVDDAEADDVCDMDQRYYRLFGGAVAAAEDDAAAQKKARQQQQLQQQQQAKRVLNRHPGKACDVRQQSAEDTQQQQQQQQHAPQVAKELPEVHFSPRKTAAETPAANSDGANGGVIIQNGKEQ